MFKEKIQEELKLLGLSTLEHLIFYNCPIGIRFEIGLGNTYNNDGTPRKEYIDNALSRATTIYNKGIKCPGILMWQVHPDNDKEKYRLQTLFREKIAPILPQEEFSHNVNMDGETVRQTEFYWDLTKCQIPMNKVFREILLGDLGGSQEFVSAVYVFDIENHVMLHLYDDRGLDIIAHDKKILIPLYQELNPWILDYDREKIDKIFVDWHWKI